MPDKFFYRTGEEIRKGDTVLIGQLSGEIELVALHPDDPEQGWYVQEYGGGVMIIAPGTFGRMFIDKEQIVDDDDLQFVSRAIEESRS